jgi:hypothetical protein
MRRRLHRVRPTGLVTELWRLVRGTEQILVRPARELPLVTIAYPRGQREGALELQAALAETWLTIPATLRAHYADVLTRMPPMVVVEMRRRNTCGCLGHFHPAGTESRLTHRLRALSGVDACEMDLAFLAIRDWQPSPLAHTAVREAAGAAGAVEFELFRLRLALLDVFLHELHHRASPGADEKEVRGHSGDFYAAALDAFVQSHYGVEFGLHARH